MSLSPGQKQVEREACEYVEANKELLLQQFVLSKNPIILDQAFTFFMAGSPGAGKTEFSKNFNPLLLPDIDPVHIDQLPQAIIRIDVDEIREFIPQYKKTNPATGTKGNAEVIQRAAAKGLEIMRNYCLDNGLSFIHDGTFGNYGTMRKLIKRSLKQNRIVTIYYIYLDPVVAWNLTKAREYIEGRNILKEKFIDQFLNSQHNVNKAKKDFSDDISLYVVIKTPDNKLLEPIALTKNLHSILKRHYANGTIKQYSPEDLLKLIN